ncbi:MAG: ABC transporter permease [Opitutales bacterium]
MPYPLYLALKQMFPSGRGISVFAALAILGVTLGVMVLVVIQSIMNGFGAEFRTKLRETSGDIRILNNGIIAEPDALVEQLLAFDDVETAVPYAEGIVMMQHANRPEFPVIHGFDVLAEKPALPLERYLTEGELTDLDDGRTILGNSLAVAVDARPGDYVEVYTPLMLDRLKRDEVLLPREFEVSGIFRSGHYQVDSRTMIITLRAMQELYGLGDGVHGIIVNVKPGVDEARFANRLNDTLEPPLRAITWMDQHSQHLFVLAFEKVAMYFVNLVTVLVAAFSIAIALYTSVLRKTREIGLLGAMGARRPGIAGIYTLQGLIVGNCGALLGFGAALLLLNYRLAVVRLIFDEATLLRFYNFLEFPVKYSANDFLVIYLLTVGLATLAGLVPALVAASRRPAEALRVD